MAPVTLGVPTWYYRNTLGSSASPRSRERPLRRQGAGVRRGHVTCPKGAPQAQGAQVGIWESSSRLSSVLSQLAEKAIEPHWNTRAWPKPHMDQSPHVCRRPWNGRPHAQVGPLQDVNFPLHLETKRFDSSVVLTLWWISESPGNLVKQRPRVHLLQLATASLFPVIAGEPLP